MTDLAEKRKNETAVGRLEEMVNQNSDGCRTSEGEPTVYDNEADAITALLSGLEKAGEVITCMKDCEYDSGSGLCDACRDIGGEALAHLRQLGVKNV